jgi:hypothetical protein
VRIDVDFSALAGMGTHMHWSAAMAALEPRPHDRLRAFVVRMLRIPARVRPNEPINVVLGQLLYWRVDGGS